jgi:rhodanese-related sulfurtransferase
VEELLALDAAGAGVEIGPGGRMRPPSDPVSSSAEDSPPPLLHADRRRDARMVDALLHAVDAPVDTGGVDTSGMDRHTMIVQVGAADLPPDEDDDQVDRPVAVVDHTGRRRTLSARVLRRLGCTAAIVPVVTDGDRPLDAGRRQRLATVHQRPPTGGAPTTSTSTPRSSSSTKNCAAPSTPTTPTETSLPDQDHRPSDRPAPKTRRTRLPPKTPSPSTPAPSAEDGGGSVGCMCWGLEPVPAPR